MSSSLEEQLWMLREEFRAFAALHGGHPPERIIDGVAPKRMLQDHLARYRFALPYVRDKRVLDMACGTGYGSDFVVRQGGPRSVVGVDLDPTAVRYATLRYRDDRLMYRQADACSAWTTDTFDTILSFETIEHVPSPDRLLESIVRLLEPGGVFIVSSPVRYRGALEDRPANPHHVQEWSLAEFTALLRQYFGSVKPYGQLFRMPGYIGPVRLPMRFMRPIMRLRGHSVEHYYFTDQEVKDFAQVPPYFVQRPPEVVVAICQEPHAARDRDVIRRLCPHSTSAAGVPAGV